MDGERYHQHDIREAGQTLASLLVSEKNQAIGRTRWLSRSRTNIIAVRDRVQISDTFLQIWFGCGHYRGEAETGEERRVVQKEDAEELALSTGEYRGHRLPRKHVVV